MAEFKELLPDSPGTSKSTGNLAIGDTRRFQVPALTPSAALARSGQLMDNGQVFPTPGDAHPTISGLFVANMTVQGHMDAGADFAWEVIAQYTVDGASFNFPPPDKGDPEFSSVSYRTFQAEVTIPVIARTATYVIVPPPLAGAGTYTSYRYKRSDITGTVVSARYVRELNLQAFNAASTEIITQQTDKLHGWAGRVWRFIGGAVSQTYRAGVWSVRYEWESEPGSPYTTFVSSPPNANDFYSAGGVWQQNDIIEIPPRLAFQRWRVQTKTLVGPPDPWNPGALSVPQIITTTVYPTQVDGWKLLPGIDSSGAAP